MIDYYIIDAFTEDIFHGNPAGVCVLEKSMPARQMQRIAADFQIVLCETQACRRPLSDLQCV